MATLDEELRTEEREVPEGTSSYSEILPAWERAFEAYKLQYKKLGDLVAADLSLSLKAIAICVVSGLLLIGFALVTWSALLVTLAYAMASLSLHWLLIAATVILLNIVVLVVLKQILTRASQSIGMSTTKGAMSSDSNT